MGDAGDAGGGPSSEPDAFWRQFERDYYALLGVARDASGDDIRARYMALSREFHPDRRRAQADAGLAALANAQYPALDRAYKVLCDPLKRRVYNLYGERGVQALEQDAALHNVLGAHLKSEEEMQRHVEDVIRRLNAQALEGQFSRSLALTVGGYMYDKQGLGMGSFTTQLAYTSFDPSTPSFTLSSELGWTPKLHCQISQPVSPHTVFMLIPELDDSGLDVSFGANQLLSPHMHGAMMWSTRDGLSASLSHDTGATQATAAVAVNKGGPNLSLQLRRALSGATTAKVSLRGSLFGGLSLAAGASRELSRRTRVALGVLLARAGVTLRVGFTRGSVRFVMPIFLSPFSAQTAFATFCAATSPFVVAAVVTQLLKPAEEKRRRRELERRRDVRVQYLAAARESAVAQQRLMVRCAQEKLEKETRKADKKGLVVLVARYGKNPTSADPREPRRGDVLETLPVFAAGSSDEDDDEERRDRAEPNGGDSEAAAAILEQRWIDVTIPLQFFVQDSTLSLHGRSKAGLLGFYNPCIANDQSVEDTASAQEPQDPDEKPKLYVRYAYDGRVFEATFDDSQVVELPSRFAQVMGPVGGVF
ncbi:hypothetical protein PybrP1_010770 [[Pythium] brassicae (nom. inval.)]|nr:hypothetical protein PybrP1_010770 [[Pythium] brassicae (nom. inval.)]